MSTSAGRRSSSNSARGTGGRGASTSKAPATREEQIARAEAAVEKARADAAKAEQGARAANEERRQSTAPGTTLSKQGDAVLGAHIAAASLTGAQRKLAAAQTRLDNLRSGKGTPEYKHAQRIANMRAKASAMLAEADRLEREGPGAKSPRQAFNSTTEALKPLPEMVGTRTGGPLGPFRAVNPFQPPDARFLRSLYGDHQLERALNDFMVSQLRATAARMGLAHPGTSKKSIAHNLAQHLLTHESRAQSIERTRRANELLDVLRNSGADMTPEANALIYGPPGV